MCRLSPAGLIRLGCCALALACQEDKRPGAPPELPISPIDASSILKSPRGSDATTIADLPQAPLRITELEGTWRGEAQTLEFGLVRGQVVVDEEGRARSTVEGSGLYRTDLFVLTHWDGTLVGVRAEDGTALELRAELQGDEIELDLPQFGQVKLRRTSKRKLL